VERGGGSRALTAGAWCLAAALALEVLRGLLLCLWGEPPVRLLGALTAAGLALAAAGGALLLLGALAGEGRR
jgi:hypothetical protein